MHACNPGFFNRFCLVCGNKRIAWDNPFARFGVLYIVNRPASAHAVGKGFNNLFAVRKSGNPHAGFFIVFLNAILLADNYILRYVNKTAGKVPRIRRTEGRVGKTFTRAVAGNEIFKNSQAFAVIGFDRHFENASRRAGKQAAHTGKLLHLAAGTARSGIQHHKYTVVPTESVHQILGDMVRSLVPRLKNFIAAFLIRHKPAAEQA